VVKKEFFGKVRPSSLLKRFEKSAALFKIAVRSTLDCGGSTPPWHHTEEKDQGGVEPPQSKVLRT